MSLKNRQNKQSFHACQQDEITLRNITPIDGRYKKQLTNLTHYFSEFAYIRYRIHVEVEYLILLSKNKVAQKLTQKQIGDLRSLYVDFTPAQANEVKSIELEINHDMKAIEYFLQRMCKRMKLEQLTPYIHWGITSDDTGNLAYSMALSQCNSQEIVPVLQDLLDVLQQIAIQNKKSHLLARTHGQPAVPTTFGKELINFYVRLDKQLKKLKNYSFEGKLMGAVGNLSAHRIHFPSIDWVVQSRIFVRSFGLIPNIHVTQVLPYDNWVSYFQILLTINGIITGLSRDLWTYIMLEEVKLRKKEGEVGSSTMPQKVNPIDFENAEGNCEIANAYFQMYERKLLQSRLQRDLSDSVVKRTMGTALAHTVLAWNSLQKGLKKIEFDTETSSQHLSAHYEVLSEAIQTQLRLKNDHDGYEKVKKMTRGKKITKQLFQEIVRTLGLSHFENLSPEQYLGYAEELTKDTTL
ncbi:MAG: adenylosuccinate lyase [Candidatus Roizmanbacteria bacterium]|nr:adenylosuccinate lyase [Candidatus Roizmanbacteria bacterium]